MPTIITTVRFINQPKPGKERATIKCDGDQLFGVWPDKLPLFQAGQSYEIEFDERTVNGAVYKNVKNAKPVSAPVKTPPQSSGSRSAYYRPTSPTDAERMFVCSLLNAAIQGGRIDFTLQGVGTSVNMLRAVWMKTFGADAIVEQADDRRTASR